MQGDNFVLDNNNANKTMANIWARQLIDGSRAMLFLNANTKNNITLTCDQECFENAGFFIPMTVSVYDLWNDGKFVANHSTKDPFVVENLIPNGGHAMYKMTPVYDTFIIPAPHQ